MSNNSKVTPQNITPKTIQVQVFIPWAIVIVMTALIGGIVLGYFGTINLHGEARQVVLQDFTASADTLSKASK